MTLHINEENNITAEKLRGIPEPLLAWFAAEKRTLPWRDRPEPYRVWISEIMLQQTRVTAVLPYFKRFTEALPTPAALAEVDDDTLMKLWESLGYYSRARSLKKAARIIVDEFGGVVPDDFETLLTLPGIGRYTAGAVSSIAYGKKQAAVDGNVLRVVLRFVDSEKDPLKDKTKRIVEDALMEILPEDTGAFNQAMMELGALVCLPKKAAHCTECPLVSQCASYKKGAERVAELPKKAPKKERRLEKRTVLLLEAGDAFAIAKRPDHGLLAGLWELPNLSGHLTKKDIEELAQEEGWTMHSIKKLAPAKHIFSHIEWHMIGWHITLSEKFVKESSHAYGPSHLPKLSWENKNSLKEQFGIPTAFQYFLK